MIYIVIILLIITGYYIHKNMIIEKELNKINDQIELKIEEKSNFAITNTISLKSVNRLTKNLNVVFDAATISRVVKEKKEKESQEILAHLAHDIRTPITSLKGYVQLLREGVSEEKRDQYLMIVDDKLKFLNSIIDNIFTYSKLSDDNYQITLKSQEVYNELCKSLALFYNEFELANMEPIIDFEDTKKEFMVNQDLLIRMYNNLISNATKYGCEKLVITQKGNCITFMNKCKNMNFDVDKIFDRFYKEDKSRGMNKSSGLGLSIVKSIMKKFKGFVSAELKGDELYIYLQFPENFA